MPPHQPRSICKGAWLVKHPTDAMLGRMTLLAFRRRLGMSQAELGRAIGIDQATVSRLERRRSTPTGTVALRLLDWCERLRVAHGLPARCRVRLEDLAG